MTQMDQLMYFTLISWFFVLFFLMYFLTFWLSMPLIYFMLSMSSKLYSYFMVSSFTLMNLSIVLFNLM